MENKKKILFVLWTFSNGGGAEKILSTIVNHINLSRYEVDILEMEHFDKGYEPVPKGVRILKPFKSKSHGRVMDALMWRMRIYAPYLVRKWLIKDDYDIEVSFTIMNPAFPFSKRPEVKKIAWVHGSIEGFLDDCQAHYRENHRQHLHEADSIIAISNKTRESIQIVYPEVSEKIHTIYNGYDFERLIQQSHEETCEVIPSESIAVIGRIEPLKGSSRVLKVFEELHQKRPNAHLYYIGSGVDEAKLKKEVRDKALDNHVHFLGYQKNPYPILKQMSVLLSLSFQEGFSGSVVEAVSLGIPFVTTEVGGAEELSSDGKYGTIITDDESAVQALIDYLTKEKSIGKDYQKFIEQFTVEQQMSKISQQFETTKGVR